jgi:hypothetical protein
LLLTKTVLLVVLTMAPEFTAGIVTRICRSDPVPTCESGVVRVVPVPEFVLVTHACVAKELGGDPKLLPLIVTT